MFKVNNKPQRRLWKPIKNQVIDMECKDRKIRAMWLAKATTTYYWPCISLNPSKKLDIPFNGTKINFHNPIRLLAIIIQVHNSM